MTRVGASAGGPRGADQADELQRPCARTSGGDAAARRQGRGTEHSLLPLRPVSRQAHSQGRPGRPPRARPPSWGPRLQETQNRARTDLRGTRPSEPRSTKVARRPSRPPGSPARVTGPGGPARGSSAPRTLRAALRLESGTGIGTRLSVPRPSSRAAPGGTRSELSRWAPPRRSRPRTGAGTDRPEGAPWDWGARRPAHDRPAVPPAHCPASPPRAGPWRCRSRTASGDARVSAPQYFSPSELLLQRPCPCRLYVERQGRRCQLARPPSCLPPSPAARPGPGCCPRSPPSPSRAGACRRVREAGWHVAP